MTPLVVVAAIAAGALGALARFGVTHAVHLAFPPEKLTRAVLIVNVAGSLLAGVLIGLPAPTEVQYVLMGGFAGGLTTFSTWSVETIQLALDGRRRDAALTVVANLAWGLLAALIGALGAGAVTGSLGAGGLFG
ncbi:MAG: CrcB family protein [Microbacteriaceae bacterium]|nr:CrcB family protein [Microbacteriaceae bacterium]